MNSIKDLEQLSTDYAVKGEAKTKLADILQSCTKDKLSAIASNWNLSGRSKMKKPELAEALHKLLIDEERLKDALLSASGEERELFEKLLKTPYVQDADLAPGTFLLGKGLIFAFVDGGKLSYLIPEEIKEAYHHIDSETFVKTRERDQLVHQYLDAAVNLYGVCKPEKLLEIFNAQNAEKLNEAELMEIYSFLSGSEQRFHIDQGYLTSNYFGEENQDEFEELLEKIKNKPYYIPEKKEFLRYSDTDYYEKTLPLDRLHTFIVQNLCKDAELAEIIVDDIQVDCSMEEPFESIMFEFERRNIHITNAELLNVLGVLINDVANHTRLWSNCGRTPFEMQKSLGRPVHGPEQVSKLRVLSKQRISNKIGRNEPCPCGSGKKYKKCCGN